MKSEHLGDGAYISFTGYSFLLTANHHDPEFATDTVSIDINDVDRLLQFIAGCTVSDEPEGK